jgi:voltage-gated potassium channel
VTPAVEKLRAPEANWLQHPTDPVCNTCAMSESNPLIPEMSRKSLALSIVQSTVRTVAVMVLIFWALSTVPEKPDSTIWLPILLIAAAVAGYGWMFSRQIRKVKAAKHPIFRSAEALLVVATMFLAVFASAYVMISAQDVTAFTEQLGHFTAFYFSLTVLATVGFGDITPVSDTARLVCMVQMALDIVFIAAAVKVLGGAAQGALKARAAGVSKGSAEQENA